MNTVQIHIDEKLDEQQLKKTKQLLMDVTHVVDVEISGNDPHEFVVEYKEHHDMPIKIVEAQRSKGLHPDIVSA